MIPSEQVERSLVIKRLRHYLNELKRHGKNFPAVRDYLARAIHTLTTGKDIPLDEMFILGSFWTYFAIREGILPSEDIRIFMMHLTAGKGGKSGRRVDDKTFIKAHQDFVDENDGSFGKGRKHLADTLHISLSTVDRAIRRLKKADKI